MDTQPAVFDRNDALERIGGDEELLQTLVDMFLAEYDSYVASLDDSLAAGDWAGFTRAAHTLKGVLATLSGQRAQTKALELEQAAKASDQTGSARLLAELKQELQAFTTALGQ